VCCYRSDRDRDRDLDHYARLRLWLRRNNLGHGFPPIFNLACNCSFGCKCFGNLSWVDRGSNGGVRVSRLLRDWVGRDAGWVDHRVVGVGGWCIVGVGVGVGVVRWNLIITQHLRWNLKQLQHACNFGRNLFSKTMHTRDWKWNLPNRIFGVAVIRIE